MEYVQSISRLLVTDGLRSYLY